MFDLNEMNLFRGKLVRLAAATPDDAEIVARWGEDSQYLRQMDTDIAFPQPAEVILEDDKKGRTSDCVPFRLRTISDNRLIGFVALYNIEWNNRSATLGIGIGDTAYQGKGYGSEALQLILRYAFHELNLNRVGLEVISYNERAVRSYEKAGFCHEGRKREAVLRNGEQYDLLVMGILRSEWELRLGD